MKVTVKYFAILKDQSGVDEEVIDGSFSSPKELYSFLKNEKGLSLCSSKLKVAINDEFSDWDVSLSDGDTVVFIPPVAGG
ncbi:MAG: MoaD/ThiS family protein [Lentisphaeraceae bacterium]|nr:MoaD/ThiS family protein [Lentisphaeraceae bacterium]